MRALVTGSSGFIGSHMVELLIERGHEVGELDLQMGSDILEPDCVVRMPLHERLRGTDWIFHFAGLADLAPSFKVPVDYMHTNCLGTALVCDAARKANIKKFIYAASNTCYGDQAPIPTAEDDTIDCRLPYAHSKWMGEETAFMFHHVYGLPVNSIRIFNAYGRRQRSNTYGSVFSTFMRQKLAGEPLTIVGDGTQMRDFVHVKDVCRAFLLAAESDHVGKVWNVGTGVPSSINNIARYIGGPTVNIPSRSSEPRITQANITAVNRDLGWMPEIAFGNGVQDMLDHIQEWAAAPLWNPESIGRETRSWFDSMRPRGVGDGDIGVE